MKDSYNYSGFSSALLVSSKKRKSTRKGSMFLDNGEIERAENDPSRFYPPYLMQPSITKAELKK